MSQVKWQVVENETVLQHPYIQVDLQQVMLPDGRSVKSWPIVHTRDYVNALVLNEAGQAMVILGYKHGLGRSSWQVLGGYLEPGEEPLEAVRRELLEETGYQSDDWQQLGSFVVDANRHVGIGHFFLAQNARRAAEPDSDDLEAFEIIWVSLAELQQALLDGRVAILSYAINIALGLLALTQ